MPVEHFDLSDMTVRIRIELYRRRGGGPAALRHFDDAGGAANSKRRLRCRDLHIAGLGDEAGDESRGAERDIKGGGVGIAAFLIDELVDDDAGIRRQTERRLVVKSNAERRSPGRFRACRS